jgi:hypothetical protein
MTLFYLYEYDLNYFTSPYLTSPSLLLQVDRLNILERTTYFAVIQYGTQANHYFTFRDSQEDLKQLQAAIANLDNDRSGPANIGVGLAYGLNFYDVAAYGARDTNKLTLVVSAGNDNVSFVRFVNSDFTYILHITYLLVILHHILHDEIYS